MEELREILYKIIDVYNSSLDNSKKYDEVSKLWTKYYMLSSQLGINLDMAYQVYLLCENECYVINQEPNMEAVDDREVADIVFRLKEVLALKEKGILAGISSNEVECLLKWSVFNVRRSLAGLGIDVSRNSLNGFCEIGQALSLMPFENLGLSVTKNKATDAFGYKFNHAFGTVTFPVMEEDGQCLEKVYLIDSTYRQFFSSVRCNYGRYYAEEENTGLLANPDPGYFVEDKVFASNLMRDGYVLLDKKSASLYGKPFYLSALDREEFEVKGEREFDYYSLIMGTGSTYSVNYSDLEGLNVEFPSTGLRTR